MPDAETRQLIDAGRSLAGRLGSMSAALEHEAQTGSQAGGAGLIAAGVLLAFGNLIDAVCDEAETACGAAQDVA